MSRNNGMSHLGHKHTQNLMTIIIVATTTLKYSINGRELL
jgi:hypothetical protein